MAARPDTVLEKALTESIGNGPVRILARQSNAFSSTFESEIVTCNAGHGTMRVFCKYGSDRYPRSHGHRGGVGYEARVYREVLMPAGLTVPRMIGAYESSAGETWLFLEYVEGHRVNKHPDPSALVRAAAWIGDVHRRLAPVVRKLRGSMTEHDVRYYRAWVERTLACVERQSFPWIADVCRRFDADVAPYLASRSPTVIHGEYTVENVLVSARAVRPVDWQSAAIGIGEFDLVSLLEGWDDDVADACKAAYRRSREAGGDFESVYLAAEIFHALRWLGEHPAWARGPGAANWYERLQTSSARLSAF